MGRKPKIENKTIAEYTESERKHYFRSHYHNKLNKCDKNRVQKICEKKIVLEHLINEVGINTILNVYFEQVQRECDDVVSRVHNS